MKMRNFSFSCILESKPTNLLISYFHLVFGYVERNSSARSRRMNQVINYGDKKFLSKSLKHPIPASYSIMSREDVEAIFITHNASLNVHSSSQFYSPFSSDCFPNLNLFHTTAV